MYKFLCPRIISPSCIFFPCIALRLCHDYWPGKMRPLSLLSPVHIARFATDERARFWDWWRQTCPFHVRLLWTGEQCLSVWPARLFIYSSMWFWHEMPSTGTARSFSAGKQRLEIKEKNKEKLRSNITKPTRPARLERRRWLQSISPVFDGSVDVRLMIVW